MQRQGGATVEREGNRLETMDASTPIPAATLILMRDRPAAVPEILMVERAAQMAFAGGALVFPGGRIDPGDAALAEVAGDATLAPRASAIRETIEEVGLAVGLAPVPDAGAVAAMRDRLHAGETLGAVLGETNIVPEALVPFARWCPDLPHARIFDTHFFLARAPDTSAVRVDGTENVRAFWAGAQDVLDQAAAGQAHVIFPTRRVLERLATFGSHAEAVASAGRYPVRTITPWLEERGGERFLCIPDDLGYPVTREPAGSALRG